MNLLVAGGTGVIGRRAVEALVRNGHRVTVLSRSQQNDALIASLGATPSRGSLFDPVSLAGVVAGHEAVVNLATSIPPSSQAFKRKAWAGNDLIRIQGSANLVNAAIAAGCERFVQESIVMGYADRGSEWIDEQVAFLPADIARCVLAAESSANRFASQGGVGVVLRFGNIYAADTIHTRANLAMVARGVAPTIGAPSAFMSSVHADDAAAAAVAALGVPAGTYNVVDDEPLTRQEVSEIAALAAGRERLRQIPRWFVAIMGGDTARMLMRSQRVSSSRFRDASGWTPRMASLRAGWPAVAAETRALPLQA